MKSNNITSKTKDKDIPNLAFVEQYKTFNGYHTTCPHCQQKFILTQLTDKDKEKLKNKEVLSYTCFICKKEFKIKAKGKIN